MMMTTRSSTTIVRCSRTFHTVQIHEYSTPVFYTVPPHDLSSSERPYQRHILMAYVRFAYYD